MATCSAARLEEPAPDLIRGEGGARLMFSRLVFGTVRPLADSDHLVGAPSTGLGSAYRLHRKQQGSGGYSTALLHFGAMPLSVSSLIAFSFFDRCGNPIPRSTLGALVNWILS